MRHRSSLVAAAGCLLALVAAVHADPVATATPSITFLDKDAAAKAIVDESVEPYFNLLRPAEMAAKTGTPITGDTLDAQREEARRRYASMAEAFTDDERATLTWYVERVHDVLGWHYPKLGALPWSFIKVQPGVEGGLPHTRGPHIVLSGPVVFAMTRMKLADANAALLSFAELLIHEQVHVAQRRDPALFRSLYTEVWGFEHADVIESHPWLDAHQVVNPDGVDVNWVMKVKDDTGIIRYVWPRIVFADVERPRMPVDFRLIAVHVGLANVGFKPVVNAEGIPQHTDLTDDAAYMASIPKVGSIYHPNEIAADVIARLVVANHLLPDEQVAHKVRDRTKAALAKEWAWMEKNLK